MKALLLKLNKVIFLTTSILLWLFSNGIIVHFLWLLEKSLNFKKRFKVFLGVSEKYIDVVLSFEVL